MSSLLLTIMKESGRSHTPASIMCKRRVQKVLVYKSPCYLLVRMSASIRKNYDYPIDVDVKLFNIDTIA